MAVMGNWFKIAMIFRLGSKVFGQASDGKRPTKIAQRQAVKQAGAGCENWGPQARKAAKIGDHKHGAKKAEQINAHDSTFLARPWRPSFGPRAAARGGEKMRQSGATSWGQFLEQF